MLKKTMPPRPFTDHELDLLLGLLAGHDDFVFLESSRTVDRARRSWIFRQPVGRLQLRAGDSVADFFDAVQGRLRQGHYLAGWFAYELGYLLEAVLRPCLANESGMLLADLGVFPAPLRIDHQDPSSIAQIHGIHNGGQLFADPGYRLEALHCNETESSYCEKIRRILEYIAAGDTYQVNYTLKMLFSFSGSPLSLYRDLRRRQRVPYSALIKADSRYVLSFSPELFFSKEGDRCVVRPMKGTIGRGRTLGEDRQLADKLARDQKNRCENVMIVDLLRNDLGRLATLGQTGVRSLFDVERYETVQQMTSTIERRLRPTVSLLEIFRALFPCGSVTGAPKIRTMEIIRQLENEPRGVYTGAIGYLAPSGEMQFSVPIRTVVIDGGRGEMGIGSGVVADSDPVDEWRETLLKGGFLQDAQPAFQLIETMLWVPGEGIWLLDYHLERLADSAAYFLFQYDEEEARCRLAALEQEMARAGRCFRVRLLLHKDGRLDCSHQPCAMPQRRLWPPLSTNREKLPVVGYAAERVAKGDRFLRHKTTRRAMYDRGRRQADRQGLVEVIYRNQAGHLTEGTISTIFLRYPDHLVTPPLEDGLLAGVLRRYVLANSPLPVLEQSITPLDLRRALAVYIGNSVRGLIEVRVADR